MKKIIASTLACVLTLSSVFSYAADAITFNESQTVPVDEVQYNSCTGENVHFTGSIHETTSGTINGNKISLKLHVNFQNLVGIGETSGTKYAGNAVLNERYNESFDGAYVATTVFNRIFTTAGGGNNLVVKAQIHTTINANGEVTNSVDTLEVACQ